MKKILALALICVFVLPLVGFKPALYVEYFHVHYEGKTISVTNKTLQSNWWTVSDKREFTQGKTLYQRADEVVAFWHGRTNEAVHETFQTNFPELWPIIKKVNDAVSKPADNGEIKFNPDLRDARPKFYVIGQKVGRELDVERLCAEILGALSRREPHKIFAHVRDVDPIDPDILLERITLRGQYSTIFTDNPSRECNIALALEAFDGLVIDANERVSFNDVVGKRTRERGFQTAKIILDGEFVDGVGGGVCQASTTIFNAVLLSGLKITQSHNHSLPISYVPLGLDAMVSSKADLEFKNTSSDSIYIESKVIDNGYKNQALVRIYGSPRDRDYIPRVEIFLGEQVEEVNGSIPTDDWFFEKKILDVGYPPRSTQTYIDIYKDGELIESKFIRKSRYKGKPRIVRYEEREVLNPSDRPSYTSSNRDFENIFGARSRTFRRVANYEN